MTTTRPAASVSRLAELEPLLRQRIAQHFRPGDRFSSEPQLAAEFGVSRTLVRRVLAKLVGDGLIRREAKRGTFVKAQPTQWTPRLSDLIERLFRYDRGTSAKALEIATMLGEPGVKERLRLGDRAPLVLVRRVVLSDGAPIAYLRTYLPYELGARLTVPDIEREPISALVAKRFRVPVRRAVQTIQPAIADMDVVRHLELPVGSPVLLVERDWLTAIGRPVFFTRAYYRGDQYKYTVTLHLDRHASRRRATGEGAASGKRPSRRG